MRLYEWTPSRLPNEIIGSHPKSPRIRNKLDRTYNTDVRRRFFAPAERFEREYVVPVIESDPLWARRNALSNWILRPSRALREWPCVDKPRPRQ